ncbi:MAG: phage distal tail protein [Candidatus Hydrogenedentota bacterium]
MPIVLGDYTFDERTTAVAEKQEEVGGRDARAITLTGVFTGLETLEAAEAALDGVITAAGDGVSETFLSLRAGRRMRVRRTGFEREVVRQKRTATFKLTLEAANPYEEAEEQTSFAWNVTASDSTQVFTNAGNVYAQPVITFLATGALIAPAISDGTRTMHYTGTVNDGETLAFDAAAGRVTLDGLDVTPYTEGVFPRLAPGDTTLTYTDEPDSTHTAAITVAYRARWW